MSFGLALQNPSVGDTVSRRLTSLSDVSKDDSFVVRGQGYEALFEGITDFPFGLGIGGQANGNDKVGKDQMVGKGGSFMLQNDSSLAAIILSLGWAGTLLTGASFLLLTAAACRLKTKSPGPAQVIKMLFLVLLSESLFDNIVNGPGGFLAFSLWGWPSLWRPPRLPVIM